eukprot:566227_1
MSPLSGIYACLRGATWIPTRRYTGLGARQAVSYHHVVPGCLHETAVGWQFDLCARYRVDKECDMSTTLSGRACTFLAQYTRHMKTARTPRDVNPLNAKIVTDELELKSESHT